MEVDRLHDQVPPSTGAHFQMFLTQAPVTIRWRLLSGNNRDMCRGAPDFSEAQACRQAIDTVVRRIADLHPLIRRDGLGGWIWTLLLDSVPVAVSGRSYDREIRCGRAVLKVLEQAPFAQVRPQMLVSDHRRWTGSPLLMATIGQRTSRGPSSIVR